jgi:hypothetical protein
MHIKEPRQQIDHMLRQSRMNMVSFSQMADTKANILLSISSVLLTISMARISDPKFTLSLVVLIAFLLVTILLALMTVFPKSHGFLRIKHSTSDADYNPFFFADYADIPYDEYASDLEDTMNNPDGTYEIMIKEIYYSGIYLEKSKYMYIRFGYMFFFAGLLFSTIILFIKNLI